MTPRQNDFYEGSEGGLGEVIEGGFQKGHWQSDRKAYSEEDIEAWNAIFEQMAEKYGPGWRILIWEAKEPPPLRPVKE